VLLTAAIILTATIINVHGDDSNGATKSEFSGRQDFTWPYPFHIIKWGQAFRDEKGNLHIKNRIWTAPFWYTIDDGEETAVRVYTVYNSVTDQAGNGPKHGQMVIFNGGVDDVPTDETTLWDATWHGMSVDGTYSGKFQGQGYGDFAGTEIMGTIERCLVCAPYNIFFIEGQILYPHGE
jgi:hypothetical protein